MRYAIISDIHSNSEALFAVLKRIDSLAIDKTYCCGDIVGYYTDPVMCLNLIQSREIETIAGNHDLGASGRQDLTCWYVAKRAIEWTKLKLDEREKQWLWELPRTLLSENFLLFHGALHIKDRPEDFHLETFEDVKLTMKEFDDNYSVNIAFYGHTHIPTAYRYDNGIMVQLSTPSSIDIKDGVKYLINPGSVGQSRDNNWRASFVVYDTDEKQVTFHQVEYNKKRTLHKAKKEGLLPDPWIIKWSKRLRNLLWRMIT